MICDRSEQVDIRRRTPEFPCIRVSFSPPDSCSAYRGAGWPGLHRMPTIRTARGMISGRMPPPIWANPPGSALSWTLSVNSEIPCPLCWRVVCPRVGRRNAQAYWAGISAPVSAPVSDLAHPSQPLPAAVRKTPVGGELPPGQGSRTCVLNRVQIRVNCRYET